MAREFGLHEREDKHKLIEMLLGYNVYLRHLPLKTVLISGAKIFFCAVHHPRG